MTPREQQAAEIKTIKPREFKLNLSDADVERLFKKAYSNGITPEKLIEGYLGDLLCGTYSHGSDERYLADEYFERCDYSMGLINSFLQWALGYGEYDYLITAIDYIDETIDEMEHIKRSTSLTPAEIQKELEACDEGLHNANKAIEDLYGSYCEQKKQHGEVPEALEKGIKRVREYDMKLRQMLEGSAPEEKTDAENDSEQFEP